MFSYLIENGFVKPNGFGKYGNKVFTLKEVLEARVPYADILANKDNDNWEMWPLVLAIEAAIPGREDGKRGIDRVKSFLSTYICEREAIEQLAPLGLYYYGEQEEDHLYFHAGYGKASPDFMDANGKTYELKMTDKYPYTHHKWWGADVHLIFKKSEFFVQNESNELIRLKRWAKGDSWDEKKWNGWLH